MFTTNRIFYLKAPPLGSTSALDMISPLVLSSPWGLRKSGFAVGGLSYMELRTLILEINGIPWLATATGSHLARMKRLHNTTAAKYAREKQCQRSWRSIKHPLVHTAVRAAHPSLQLIVPTFIAATFAALNTVHWHARERVSAPSMQGDGHWAV